MTTLSLASAKSLLKALRLNPWRELAILCLIFMELSWIVPWFRLLASLHELTSTYTLFVLGTIMLLAYLLARGMALSGFPTLARSTIFLFFLGLSSLVGLKNLFYSHEAIGLFETLARLIRLVMDLNIWIPREFGTVLLILLVSIRGASLGLRTRDPDIMMRSFWVGILMLFLYGTITIGSQWLISEAWLYLFLLSSLLAMSAYRISTLNLRRGGQVIPFDRYRLLEIGLFIIGIAGLSILASDLTRNEPVFPLLLFIYYLLVRMILVAVILLASPLILLLAFFLPRGFTLPDQVSSLILWIMSILQQIQLWILKLQARAPKITFQKLLLYKPYFYAILVLGLLLVAVFLLKRRLEQDVDRPEMESEKIQSDQDFQGRLGFGIRRLAEQLLNRGRLRHTRRLFAAARIRRIYADLIDLSARQDQPRQQSQTPLEFLPVLVGVFPGRQEDLILITEAYLKVRYGELPETSQELEAVEAAWQRISASAPKKK